MKIRLTVTLFFALICTQFALAQASNCDVATIPKGDVKLINEFWVNFKKAVNEEDKAALKSLIRFPIICDYCQDVSSNKLYIKISKRQFDKKQFEIFLDPKLIRRLNETETIFTILISGKNDSDKCAFSFGYGSIAPSKNSEGHQHFFSIEKIKGKYFITSAWTL